MIESLSLTSTLIKHIQMTRSKYHTYYICYHFDGKITNVEKQNLIFIYLCIITSSFIEKVGVEIV